MTVHVRARMPRRGFRHGQITPALTDEAVARIVKTLCGAEVTDKDIAWKDARTKWAQANACPACIRAYNDAAVTS